MIKRPRIPTQIERAVLTESGHRCAVCGESCPLERAHIIPWHRSKAHRQADLICLCANCHARADLENWGETTLRIYKLNPWVLRKRALEPPTQHDVAHDPSGETQNWIIPAKYTTYLAACRRLIEEVDLQERFDSGLDSAPLLCPRCFRNGTPIETLVTQKSQYRGDGGFDGINTLERDLYHQCPSCGTVVRGFLSVLTIGSAVPRVTFPNLSKRFHAVHAYTSRVYNAMRENDDEAFSSVLSLHIREKVSKRHRIRETKLESDGRPWGGNWYHSPINCRRLLGQANRAKEFRELWAKHFGPLADLQLPSLCSLGLDSFVSTVGFYRDMWDEVASIREFGVSDTIPTVSEIRCAEHELSRARRLLRVTDHRVFRLVIALNVEEWSLSKSSKEPWRLGP